MDKQINKETQRLTIRQLYEQAKARDKAKAKELTEVQKFFNEVCTVTLKNESTVRKWLEGKRKPSPLVTTTLAKHFGVDPEFLFQV